MDQIVQYQLQRAATSGRTALMAPVDLEVMTHKIASAMDKVYAEKSLKCHIDIEAELEFHCQEGDIMELLGNLVDNAFKWAKQRIEISIRQDEFENQAVPGLLVEISDDGPGIEEKDLETVLARGGRLDPATQGHGLGLAMVQNIVELYQGELRITRAQLGGAKVTLWLPWS